MHDVIPPDLALELTLIAALHEEVEARLQRENGASPSREGEDEAPARRVRGLGN